MILVSHHFTGTQSLWAFHSPFRLCLWLAPHPPWDTPLFTIWQKYKSGCENCWLIVTKKPHNLEAQVNEFPAGESWPPGNKKQEAAGQISHPPFLSYRLKCSFSSKTFQKNPTCKWPAVSSQLKVKHQPGMDRITAAYLTSFFPSLPSPRACSFQTKS